VAPPVDYAALRTFTTRRSSDLSFPCASGADAGRGALFLAQMRCNRILTPAHTPAKTEAKKTQPDTEKAINPESKVPMVHPRASMEPQPIKTPPSRAVKPFRHVTDVHSNSLPITAMAKEATTRPEMSRPLLLIVWITSVTQPENPSRPLRRSANMFHSVIHVRARLPI